MRENTGGFRMLATRQPHAPYVIWRKRSHQHRTIDGAAGAMASDSISLARWWRALCAGQIVSQASLTEMSTFYDNVESELPVDYGLGLFNPAQRASVEAVGHLGANFGYKSSAGCLTEDPLIFVVLTNQDLDSFALATPLLMAALSD